MNYSRKITLYNLRVVRQNQNMPRLMLKRSRRVGEQVSRNCGLRNVYREVLY
jgi:hypothetical protein